MVGGVSRVSTTEYGPLRALRSKGLPLITGSQTLLNADANVGRRKNDGRKFERCGDNRMLAGAGVMAA